MPRAYSIEIRQRFLACLAGGMSVSEASVLLGISAATGHRWNGNEDIAPRYANCKGQRKLSEREREEIVLSSIEDPFKPATRITKELELSASVQTTRRILRQEGLAARQAAKKIKPESKTECAESSGRLCTLTLIGIMHCLQMNAASAVRKTESSTSDVQKMSASIITMLRWLTIAAEKQRQFGA